MLSLWLLFELPLYIEIVVENIDVVSIWCEHCGEAEVEVRGISSQVIVNMESEDTSNGMILNILDVPNAAVEVNCLVRGGCEEFPLTVRNFDRLSIECAIRGCRRCNMVWLCITGHMTNGQHSISHCFLHIMTTFVLKLVTNLVNPMYDPHLYCSCNCNLQENVDKKR